MSTETLTRSILTRESDFYRPLFYGKIKIGAYKIFNKEGVIQTLHCGYLDPVKGGDISELHLPGEIKKKLKVDFSSKSAYIMKEYDNTMRESMYALYIPAEMVSYTDLGEKQYTDSKTQTTYRKHYTLTLVGKQVYDPKDKPEPTIRTVEFTTAITRIDTKDFGKEVQVLKEKLKALNIDLYDSDVEKILENFIIVEK